MFRIILASKSPYKKKLLSRLTFEFETISPKVPEARKDGEKVEDMVMRLAFEKGEAVKKRLGEEFEENTVIISTDQAVALDDDIMGKQDTFEAAKDLLLKLSGKTHRLVTGLVVFYKDQVFKSLDIHHMTMRELSIEEIARYLVKDKPFDSAGAYKLEALGISLFSSVEGKDPSAIQGLSLIELVRILHEIGVPVP